MHTPDRRHLGNRRPRLGELAWGLVALACLRRSCCGGCRPAFAVGWTLPTQVWHYLGIFSGDPDLDKRRLPRIVVLEPLVPELPQHDAGIRAGERVPPFHVPMHQQPRTELVDKAGDAPRCREEQTECLTLDQGVAGPAGAEETMLHVSSGLGRVESLQVTGCQNSLMQLLETWGLNLGAQLFLPNQKDLHHRMRLAGEVRNQAKLFQRPR
ncbi:MAG: hypothetical protein P8Y25_12055, partial [Chromatiaceae bacterium]